MASSNCLGQTLYLGPNHINLPVLKFRFYLKLKIYLCVKIQRLELFNVLFTDYELDYISTSAIPNGYTITHCATPS